MPLGQLLIIKDLALILLLVTVFELEFLGYFLLKGLVVTFSILKFF